MTKKELWSVYRRGCEEDYHSDVRREYAGLRAMLADRLQTMPDTGISGGSANEKEDGDASR